MILAKLALSLQLIDDVGLQRAVSLMPQLKGKSFDRVLLEGRLIDQAGHKRLVASFNQRLKAAQQGGPPPTRSHQRPNLTPGRPPPRPAPMRPAPAPRFDAAARNLEDSGILRPDPPTSAAPPTPAYPHPGRGAPPARPDTDPYGEDLERRGRTTEKININEIVIPLPSAPDEDDAVFDEPTMIVDASGEQPGQQAAASAGYELVDDDEDDAVFDEPTMIVADDDSSGRLRRRVAAADEDLRLLDDDSDEGLILHEDEPTMVVEEEANDDEEAILAQPTLMLREDDGISAEEEALLAEPTLVIPSDEDSLAGGSPLELESPLLVPDEDAILAQPTVVLKEDADEDAIFQEPTLVVAPEGARQGPRDDPSAELEIDTRMASDAHLELASSGRRSLQPGVRPRAGGPLHKDEFARRLKMRLDFKGFSLGDYKIVDEISRGAFGVVLEVEPGGVAKSLARERGYEGHLALKVMLDQAANKRETERFIEEIRVLIGLDHPHIIRIFDAGVAEGMGFFSMELVKGTETKAHIMKHGPLPPLLAVRVVKEIASALGYVHQQRVYHRDLKPQNIMLDMATQPYRALLIDFGLVTEHQSQRDKGLIMGTPSYMPPEQAQPRGGHGEVNATSDIYALGASFYFLLTGKPPFSGRDPRKIIKEVVSQRPKSPIELNPAIPKRVSELCMKCLEKRQRDRFHSAKQLEQELEKELKSGQRKLKARSFFGKLLGGKPGKKP
jgi:Protein kinase domain